MYLRKKINHHISVIYYLLCVILTIFLGLPQGLASGIQVASMLQPSAVVAAATQGQPARVYADGASKGTTQDQYMPEGASSDWWSAVQADINLSEYQVSWQDHSTLPGLGAGYQAPNRAQGWRTYFTPEGIQVVPRTESIPSWEWGLRLSKWGYAGALQPVGEAALVVEANRVEYQWGALTEWYVNDERGLEQGFTLSSPPQSGSVADSTWIVLAMDLVGDLNAVLDRAEQAIHFTTKGGGGVLRYTQLLAFDAAGVELPVKFALESESISILVNTKGAEYPLTIDPLASTPSWTAEIDQEGAFFGWSVATAGDVNGDGYADVIVGAPFFDNGEINDGRVFVYHGSENGLHTSYSWIAEADKANANFGTAVGTAGDVNGDGYDDVIVGASGYDLVEGGEGRAYVYHGSSAGLDDNPDWIIEGDQNDENLGHAVGTAGDVNGDGYADVIVSSPGTKIGEDGEGQVLVYLGGISGLSKSPAWTVEGENVSARFGWSVGTAGDVNGDGYTDIIIGTPYYADIDDNQGKASVYRGSAAGLSGTPAWIVEGDQVGAYEFGRSVGTAGDVNGDGYADIIVGAQYTNNGKSRLGRAFVYFGSIVGLNGDPNWTAEGEYPYVDFGRSVGTAGDVNGDGYADVIIGAYGYNNEVSGTGSASVYHGGVSGLSSTPDWVMLGDQERANFGYSVGMAGDVNGDGYADVIIGAPYYDNGENVEGLAFVYQGSAAGLSTNQNWTAEGDQASAWFGYSVGSAGDINGDGFADVIVGAHGYDNGEPNEGRVFVYHGSNLGPGTSPDWVVESDQIDAYFGNSVGTAGDVNGDGFADVIVGAPYYDNGEDNEGRVYVYHGSAAGLSNSPNWTAESDQVEARFGWSAGIAGDVNGDGFADVIVGAPYFDDGEKNVGQALVFHGSPSGLDNSPAWTAESGQANAVFGYSVGTAGDVNGDGYADVIIGARYYDNDEVDEGVAFVYHGSSTGLSSGPAWAGESNQAEASYGRSVGTAGDVNGDGYADVIVGALNYDNGETDEGRVYVYHGSALGLNASADWTAESDQVEAYFGRSVGTAGDVNGDGFADVIVGSPFYDDGQVDEGVVFVYHGGPSGLSASADWTAECNQVDASLGWSVGTAGDVNGDGYADVIVGARYFDSGLVDTGQVYIYYGNASSGRVVLVRQVQPDGTPVQPWGLSGAADSFQVRMLASHPLGRERVKLQVEACPPGEAFNSTACLTHTAAEWTDTTTAAAGVTLIETVSGLQADTLYYWRARVLYAPLGITQPGITPPPYPAHGPWRLYQGGSQQADLRTSLNPVPVLTNLDPVSSIAGGSDFTLMVEGDNFIADVSTVQWDGADQPTTFVSNNELEAQINASDIATEGSVEVTVYNSGPGGGISNALTFMILPAGRVIYLPLVGR